MSHGPAGTAPKHLGSAPSCWLIPICHQFAALSACAAWDELEAPERAALRPRIDESLAALRELADHALVNFAHRVSLIEGELRRMDGDSGGAVVHFEEALERATEHAWVGEVALAHELIGCCLRGLGRTEEAGQHRVAAEETYARWGASAKLPFLA